MRKALLLTLVMICCAGLAFAQNGSIGLFADAGATDCDIVDALGIIPVYLIHVYAVGATATQFMVEVDACVGASSVGETYNFALSMGTFLGGISISYQTCMNGNINLGYINFFGQGTSGNCCYMHVVPDPNANPAGEVWTVDCATPDGNLVAVTGGELIVNPTAQVCIDACQVPAEQNTWGQIKSLYNE